MSLRDFGSIKNLISSGHPLANAVANLGADWVLPESVMESFLKEWIGTQVFATPEQAWEAGKKIIADKPSEYLLKSQYRCGEEVTTLFRIMDILNMEFLLDDDQRNILVQATGFSQEDLESGRMSPEEAEVIESFLSDEPIYLGNRLGLVWSTAYQDVENITGDASRVKDRLGVEKRFALAIMVAYDRLSLDEEWLVPSSLDGFEQPLFAMSPPGSTFGHTVPLTTGTCPVREGVHRSTRITPRHVWVRKVENI